MNKIYITNRARDIIVGTLAVSFLSFCAWSLITTRSWINKSFPGFLLLKNQYVALLYLPEWDAFKRGIKFGDVIVAVEGQPVKSASEVLDYVSRQKPGTPLTYEILRNNKKLQLTIPVLSFTFKNYLVFFLLLECSGLFIYFNGLAVFYLKPNSKQSWAFLLFGIIFGITLAVVPSYCTDNLSYIFLFFFPLTGASVLFLCLFFPGDVKSRKYYMGFLAITMSLSA